MIDCGLTKRAADGASAPFNAVGLPASAHFDQAVLPIRPAANANRWAHFMGSQAN